MNTPIGATLHNDGTGNRDRHDAPPDVTPWGKWDTATKIAKGIWLVETPSHGGVKLSGARNAKVPGGLRHMSGWYEEDCSWAIPALVFEKDWRTWADTTNWTSGDSEITAAKKIIVDWWPHYARKLAGIEPTPENSHTIAKYMFDNEHRSDYIVVTAWGSWHDQVPAGMVGVLATIGGSRSPTYTGDKRYFLVPEDEYDHRSDFGFVVDPSRYKEIDAIS